MTETLDVYAPLKQSCLDYIDALYQGISGFVAYQPGEKEENKKHKIFLTYGEISYSSMDVIIKNLSIQKNDVFYDLGSGIGKIPLYFYLKTPVKKASGIEASVERQYYADNVYQAVKQKFPKLFNEERELYTLQGNFLKADISDASIVYSCSTCFDEELLTEMGKILDNCPNLRYVISMKPIPLLSLILTEVLEVECTWDKVECLLYTRL